MAIDVQHNVQIRGIACCVPAHVVEIDEFRQELGEAGLEKFKKTTGVRRKHCCRQD